jgi:hypothetical protein
MPSETHLTITIPGTVSPTTLGPLRDRLEHAVQSCLATHCDITAEGAVTLHRDDARVAGYAMLHALRLQEIIMAEFPDLPPLRHADRIRRLVVRLIGDSETVEYVSIAEATEQARRSGDLTR